MTLPDYPHLLFKKQWDLSNDTFYKLGQCDAIVEAISQVPLPPEKHGKLLEVSLTKGAQATTAIEGNTLSQDEIEQVAAGQTLPPSKEYQAIEVKNILDAMNTLLKDVAEAGNTALITSELIQKFHEHVSKGLGEHLDAIPGRFRQDNRHVGPYRCPPPQYVQQLVNQLCAWLRDEFHFGTDHHSFAIAVIQAIVTHVYIEWIHPFGDGNGRTGRMVEFYILLRAGNPDIASHILSNFYNQTRPEYYRQLENARHTKDLSDFIDYAVLGFRDGLLETLHTIQDGQFEIAWKSYIHEQFAAKNYRKKNVFKRQRELMLNFPIGKSITVHEASLLSTKLARDYANVQLRTIKRDIDILKDMELVIEKEGKFEANTYQLRQRIARRRK